MDFEHCLKISFSIHVVMNLSGRLFTYSKFPLRLPQPLDGVLVWVDGVELVSENPVGHLC